MTTAITIWLKLGLGRRAATRPLLPTSIVAMSATTRTALGVAGLVAANVLVGRLITGPLGDLPAEHRLNHDLRARGDERTTAVANALSRSSDTSRAIAIGVGLTGLLLVRGRNRAAAVPGLAMALASATHVTSSALVGRERPALERLGTKQPTSSFPSGHVGAMTALAVVLGRLAEPLPLPTRVAARAGLIGYLASLGWSRLYNGQHYASDVLAGYVNGVVAARLARHALDGG
jgi:undecaprenyl-diphosphatase